MKMVFRYLALAIFLSIAALTEDASTVGKADPQIAAALKQVSAKQIQANIEKLVSFQTRLTISAQDLERSRPATVLALPENGSRRIRALLTRLRWLP